MLDVKGNMVQKMILVFLFRHMAEGISLFAQMDADGHPVQPELIAQPVGQITQVGFRQLVRVR